MIEYDGFVSSVWVLFIMSEQTCTYMYIKAGFYGNHKYYFAASIMSSWELSSASFISSSSKPCSYIHIHIQQLTTHS